MEPTAQIRGKIETILQTWGEEQPKKEQNEITKLTPERERFSVPHAARDPKILEHRSLENEDIFELIKNPPEIEQSESLNSLNSGIRPLAPLRQ